jgi:two-component system chemotaxis response regulator CheY
MAYHLMIVDDSPTMRRVIRKTVTLSGVPVEEFWEAGDGREALEILRCHPIDLILTDINMPRMNGLEMLKEMQKEEMWRKIPVVLITSQDNNEHFRETSGWGVKGYLQKPFHPEALRDLLSHMEEENRV